MKVMHLEACIDGTDAEETPCYEILRKFDDIEMELNKEILASTTLSSSLSFTPIKQTQLEQTISSKQGSTSSFL